MARIYGSFAELVEEHRGVFGLLESRGAGLDVPRAVWDVRQPEVDRGAEALRKAEEKVRGLQDDVARLEEGGRRFARETAAKDAALADCGRRAEALADRARALEGRLRALEGESAGKDARAREMESARGRAAAEKGLLARENAALGERLAGLSAELRRQREAALRLAEEARAKDERVAELGALLDKERAYSRQYRRINNRMSVEMDRMGREVEALRAAVH